MKTHHNARYPYLWYATSEEERIIRENRALFDKDVQFFSWDICAGFQGLTQNGGDSPWVWTPVDQESLDPKAALEKVTSLPEDSVVFMKDFHHYLNDITVVRQALNIKPDLKGGGRTIVFLSPTRDIPVEMLSDITVMDFEFPDREALKRIAKVVGEDQEMALTDKDLDSVSESLMGMTAEAAENALCFSYVKHGNFDVRTILDEKAALLKAGGVLEYGRFTETFDNLYGLDVMKKFVLGTIFDPDSRGVLIYGVPGTGKSAFCKALGNAVDRAVLIANFSAVRDKYQGVAEARTDWMFKTVEAFGRPIVFADESEKAFSGTGSADTDGGVGTRNLGQFLTYMADRKKDGSYWIGTMNNLDEFLHLSGGALIRRFDAVFFVDMPNEEECRGIAKIWSGLKGVEIPEDFDFKGEYTGADIENLATKMKMMDCSADEASEMVIPYGRYNKDTLDAIRRKAEGVCIWATSREKKYQPAPSRKVKRDASWMN